MLRDELYASPDKIVSIKNDSVDGDIIAFVFKHLKDNKRLRK
jgi:hypothetical protein